MPSKTNNFEEFITCAVGWHGGEIMAGHDGNVTDIELLHRAEPDKQ